MEAFHPLFTDEELRRAKEQAPDPLPSICKINDLPSTATPVIVEGLWRRQEILLLGGHAKSWKSWAQMDLSYCIANGLPWLIWDKIDRSSVLHIDLELFDFEIRKRFEVIQASHGAGSLNSIDVLSLRGCNFSLSDFSDLSGAIPPDKYSVISIDPVYRMLAGSGVNESDPGVIIDLMNRSSRLVKKTGAGLSLLQHFSKGNQSEKRAIDSYSGSGVWGRAPDICMAFREHEEEKSYQVSVDQRHWLSPEPFAARFAYPRFELAAELDPENLKRQKPPGRPSVFSTEDLCNLINSDEYVSYSDLLRRAEVGKTNKRTFERRLKDAKLQGFLALNPTDSTYFLTSLYLKKHPR